MRLSNRVSATTIASNIKTTSESHVKSTLKLQRFKSPNNPANGEPRCLYKLCAMLVMKHILLAALTGFVLVLVSPLEMHSQEGFDAVKARGTAEYINGFSAESKAFQFEALLSTNCWKIKIFPTGHEYELGHVEYGFGGTDQFFLEFVNIEPYTTSSSSSNVFINGSVAPNDLPISLTSFIHVYWLAFNYCCNASIQRPPPALPAAMLSGARNTNLFAAQYLTSPEGLINKVELLNPGFLYGVSGNTYQQPAPYDKGFVTATLNIAERKTLQHMSIPTVWEWKVLMPVENGRSPEDLRTIHQLVLKTSTVESYDKNFQAVPTPPSGQMMIVRDYRLARQANEPDALYVSSNGFWKPEDENFRKRVRDFVSVQSVSAKRTTVSRIVFLGFFLFTSLAAWLLLSRRNTSSVRS